MKHRREFVLHERRKKKSRTHKRKRNQKAWDENYLQYMWKQCQNL